MACRHPGRSRRPTATYPARTPSGRERRSCRPSLTLPQQVGAVARERPDVVASIGHVPPFQRSPVVLPCTCGSGRAVRSGCSSLEDEVRRAPYGEVHRSSPSGRATGGTAGQAAAVDDHRSRVAPAQATSLRWRGVAAADPENRRDHAQEYPDHGVTAIRALSSPDGADQVGELVLPVLRAGHGRDAPGRHGVARSGGRELAREVDVLAAGAGPLRRLRAVRVELDGTPEPMLPLRS